MTSHVYSGITMTMLDFLPNEFCCCGAFQPAGTIGRLSQCFPGGAKVALNPVSEE
jgi:hypothetical protein